MQPGILAKSKGRNGSAYDNRQKKRHAPAHEAGVMNRPLAVVSLVLLIIGLLLSTAAFFQGRVIAGLSLYPLLIIIYMLIQIGKKKKQ